MILGMKVRKHDIDDMLKFNPTILEFHFSDSDLNLNIDRNFEQQLMVHCYEYFDRKIVDMVSLNETNQIHSQEKSIEFIQKAIEKTISLGKHFKGKPSKNMLLFHLPPKNQPYGGIFSSRKLTPSVLSFFTASKILSFIF